jgi:ABC-2 type transport system permease protein
MSAFAALVRKELLILARDRHGLGVLFVMPAIFILIMSLALRDAMDPGRHTAIKYAWLDEDGGYFALSVADRLASRPTLERLAVKDEGTLLDVLRSGRVPFAVRIRKGLDQRVATEGAPLAQVYLSPTAAPQARLLFGAEVRAALAHVQAEYLLEDRMGVPHEDAQKLRDRTDPSRLQVDETWVGASAGSGAAPNAVQQSVPAWLVFAMFFVVLPIATSVLAEREQGNLQRLALLNVPPTRLLAAKFPAYYAVNLVQFLLMLAVGTYLVPLLGGDRLDPGRSVAGLWLVATGLSVAAVGFALLIAVIARTAVQATVAGGIANLILGAIGGVMVPKLVMPPAMQAASQLSPMSWALEACWDILLRGGGAADALPECAALIAFGLACYGAAALLFPKTEA